MNAILSICPEKADYVGTAALTVLIQRGGQGARNMRFTTPRGIALVVVLMLAFGHGCGADPLYPWITRPLREQPGVDPNVIAARLDKRALTWLTQVLKQLGETEV